MSTYHGTFSGAEGWHYVDPAPDTTAVEHLTGLRLNGSWDVTVPPDAAQGDVVQVTGRPRGEWFPPGLTNGHRPADWTLVAETARTLQLTKPFVLEDGTLFFTYDLVLNKATGELTITMPIEGRLCPAGWKTLVLHGESRG